MGLCTINTDASFLPDSKRGGWAFWITCDEYVLKSYGGFKESAINVQHAEGAAVCNAIHSIIKRGVKFDKVIINCDNLTVVHAINDRTFSTKVPSSIVLAGLLHQLGCPVEARHVRAHSHTLTARNYVNSWCDQYSRKYLFEK